jgi:hypothetical protein
MQMVSTRTAAIRMAILLCAIDVAAALLIAKPRLCIQSWRFRRNAQF